MSPWLQAEKRPVSCLVVCSALPRLLLPEWLPGGGECGHVALAPRGVVFTILRKR